MLQNQTSVFYWSLYITQRHKAVHDGKSGGNFLMKKTEKYLVFNNEEHCNILDKYNQM